MWLLETGARQAMQRATRAGFTPTAEQQANFEARFGGEVSANGDNRLLTTAGNSAQIEITGVMTKKPSFMAMIYGGGNTTYREITAAIAAAEQDDNISDITYLIDSPGGNIDGMFDAIEAMKSASKPSKAVVSGTCASAAYALATQADTIEASNVAAVIGSIGIVQTFYTDDDEVTITSTHAPNKRPDVTTPEGVAVVRGELDEIHDLFVDAIAEGRGVSAIKINADFGQGGVVLANEALKRGMIDAVSGSARDGAHSVEPTTAAKSGTKPEAIKMDLTKLKAQHADVYAAAVQLGVDQERDRVGAHMTMGTASGDMKTATAAISDGSVMTAQLQATYMAAGMNRADIEARAGDDADAGGADTSNTPTDTATQDAAASAAILSAAASSCGVDLGA